MYQRVPDDADDVDQYQRHEELHVQSNTILSPQVPAATITAFKELHITTSYYIHLLEGNPKVHAPSKHVTDNVLTALKCLERPSWVPKVV